MELQHREGVTRVPCGVSAGVRGGPREEAHERTQHTSQPEEQDSSRLNMDILALLQIIKV